MSIGRAVGYRMLKKVFRRLSELLKKLGQIASCGRGSELAIHKIKRSPSRDRRESILD